MVRTNCRERLIYPNLFKINYVNVEVVQILNYSVLFKRVKIKFKIYNYCNYFHYYFEERSVHL